MLEYTKQFMGAIILNVLLSADMLWTAVSRVAQYVAKTRKCVLKVWRIWCSGD